VVHVVRDGDTVGQLATLYGSTVEAIITANGLSSSAFIRVGQALIIPVRLAPPATSTPTATLPPPAATATSSVATPIPTVPTQTPTTTTYIVQPGDTLLRIALRFNTTIAAISQLNGITNPNVIRYGQRLIIPVGGGVVVPSEPSPPQPPTAAPQQTYVVRPGDTLFRIALRFGVPLNRLIQANGITDPNRVFVGQVLVIP
jgi:LysM repeat protein